MCPVMFTTSLASSEEDVAHGVKALPTLFS